MATLRSAKRWEQDEDNLNRYLHLNVKDSPEYKQWEEEYKRKKKEEDQALMDKINVHQINLAKDIKKDREKFGGRPSESIWEQPGETSVQTGMQPGGQAEMQPGMQPSGIEQAVGARPSAATETGAGYSPATQSTGYGEKKYSNMPERAGDPSVGYVKEAPEAKGPNVTDKKSSVEEMNALISYTLAKEGGDVTYADPYSATNEKVGVRTPENEAQWNQYFKQFTDKSKRQRDMVADLKIGYYKMMDIENAEMAARAAAEKVRLGTEKGKLESKDKDEKRLLELSGELVKLAGERRKLKKEQTEIGAGVYDPNEMVSINRLNAQVDNQQKAIQSEISRLEARLGKSAPAQTVAPQAATTQTENVKPQTPLQKKAAAFVADSIARGETKEQAFARFQAEQSAGKGTDAGTGKTTPAAKPAPAKIIKPAPTTPAQKSSDVSESWGLPPPSTSPSPASDINIGGQPVTINTKDMVDLAKSVGITKENLDTYLKVAADINGSTVELLLTKPYNAIKQLLQQAVASQTQTRKGMGL